jgi:hypothetical protein
LMLLWILAVLVQNDLKKLIFMTKKDTMVLV